MAGAVTGTGTIAFSGGKDISATASFPDFTGTLELGNASLAFGDGCSLGRDAAFVAKDNGILALGGDQVFGSISGLGTSGGLSIPAGAVATVSGAKAASNGTMLFRAAIRGEGGLTLDAPGRTLVLNGVNGYRGPTHVAAGTLTLRNDRRTCFPDGLVARYSFDGAFLGDSSPTRVFGRRGISRFRGVSRLRFPCGSVRPRWRRMRGGLWSVHRNCPMRDSAWRWWRAVRES